MKKFISLLLVAVMLFAFGAPVAKAAAADVRKVDAVINELKTIEPTSPTDQKALEKLETEADKFRDQVRYNPDTIYDLDSIPARIMLLGKLGLAMRFATTELVNKVDAAHAKVAGYIFGGLVYIANPFNTIEDLEEYGERLDALKAECLAMPDMGPDDTANLYRRAALDELLTKARFMRFNELKEKDGEVIKTLDKAIRKATIVRIKPQSTLADIDAAEVELLAAMDIARKAEGKRADKKLIKQLRELVWEARGRIIKAGFGDDDVEELKEVTREASKELLKIRPSEKAVKDFMFAINALL
ncbi:MAG: CAMP factor family pore-forming toxin [Tissierellia bacterium]|nr:CAMP factor family pore-forming toxin [Tissierellia bacterium]